MVNDVPNQESTYSGPYRRTARAGAKGKAITLVSYSSAPDFEVIKRKVKVEMTDLNKEMGIEVDIPDPLKRQVSRRGFGRGGGGGRDRNSGRDNRRFERRPRRDGDGGGRFDRSSRPSGGRVFCSTKYRTRDVAHDLRKMDFNSVAIEGDMSQHRREQSMTKFRSGKADILVATDVASRGIDVPHVGLVVNYDVPNQELTYFHRIGRTARAGAKGKAITLVSYSSAPDFEVIKRKVKVEMTDLNKEMGIEVDIPDPLKRQVSRRGFGRGGGGGRDRNSGRDNRRFERRPRRDGDGGGRFDRSSRPSGGRFDRSSGGGGRFDRSSRPSGGRFDRSSGGGGRFDRSSRPSGGRSDRSGGSFDRSSRPSGGRYDRNGGGGGRFDRSSKPSGGRFDRSSGGGGRFDRSSRPSGGRYDRNNSSSFDRSSRPSGGRFNRNDDRRSDGPSERGGGRFERNDRSEKKSFGNNDDGRQSRDSTFREKRKRSF